MRRLTLALATVLTLAAAPAADARDTRHQFDIATAIAAGKADGTLDGSVQFHFKGARAPAVTDRLGAANTNRKTNAFGKSDATACQWVFLGAMKALQAAAKERGANAVIDIESNYKNQVFSSATQYECGAGGLMAGVALKGVYAKVK
ncbi:excinuclease ATPase subunit [Thermomonas carbonis]|uniref:Excinuclease ATPase subunit n=1 Tax=Thermomonas carbonis TaxID=1463158 RepID=A0A7G9SP43_9GAMM|nr:excinuclease ATPase subunit [Thermomonas carbonis]QNN69618.1 excinuclease ATPase subunit [Thermomonas carbonis]GHB94341.1 phosphoribosylglycinamide formyltransferase [Thermomonas carbonis]